MIPLVLQESRMLMRRAVWPVTLTLHAITTSAFVAIWGPTGGVPLWEASTLHQLTGAERLITAVLLTWLATCALTDHELDGRVMTDWSALTGRPAKAIFRARLVLVMILAIVFVVVAAPSFFAAAASAAATASDLAVQAGIAAGFAAFCVGVTAVASVAVRDRVAVWCTAMAISLVAAAAVQLLGAAWLRIAVPAVCGVALMVVAPAGVNARRLGRAA